MDSKANSLANFSAKLPVAIKGLVYPHEGSPILSVKEIAVILQIADRTAYDKIDKGTFTWIEFATLAHAYGELGDFTLLNIMMPDGWNIVSHKCTCVNGSLDDECKDLIRDVAEVAVEFDRGNYKGAIRKLPRVKSVVARFEKELEAKA